MQADTVAHRGEVVSVTGSRVKVLLRSASACSSCHAKGACSSADFQDKYIETQVSAEQTYIVGEKVWVSCNDKQGFYALFWAYVFPMILVVVLLFFCFSFWKDELKAGLVSLAVLPFYYAFLYVGRRFFAKKLHMKIKKIDS